MFHEILYNLMIFWMLPPWVPMLLRMPVHHCCGPVPNNRSLSWYYPPPFLPEWGYVTQRCTIPTYPCLWLRGWYNDSVNTLSIWCHTVIDSIPVFVLVQIFRCFQLFWLIVSAMYRYLSQNGSYVPWRICKNASNTVQSGCKAVQNTLLTYLD